MDLIDEYKRIEDELSGSAQESGFDSQQESGFDDTSTGFDSTSLGIDGAEEDMFTSKDIEDMDIEDLYKAIESEIEEPQATPEQDEIDLVSSISEEIGEDFEADNRAATSIMGNAMGYTNTGMQIGMNPAAAPPKGFVERENQQYDARISVEEAQNKVDEYNAKLRSLRARKASLKIETSSVATALGSALMNVGVSGPDLEAAKKMSGSEDRKVQAQISDLNKQIQELEYEAQPYKVELQKAKNNMYGKLFKKGEGLMDEAEAARTVRQTQESIDKEIERLESLKDKKIKEVGFAPENWTQESAAAFRKEVEETNDTIEQLEVIRERIGGAYADVYTHPEYGTPGSADWSGEVEQVDLLGDPVFNLMLMYPGLKLGSTFGREAASALTYGGSDLAHLAGSIVKGTAKLGWKGVKELNPKNARAAASLLGRGVKSVARGMPEITKMSAKALYESPKTMLKYGKNIKMGLGNLYGETKSAQRMWEDFASSHPKLATQQMLEEAGAIASGDIDPNQVAVAYRRILSGPRPGKGVSDLVLGEKAADKLRQGKFVMKHLFVDRSAAMKEILKSAGEAGKDAIRRFEMLSGTPTYSKLRARQAIETVNEGLDRVEERYLNQMIFARSEIAAEDYLVARSQWDDSTLKMMERNLKENGSLVKHPHNYTREELENILDEIEASIYREKGDDGKIIIDKIKDRADRFFKISRGVLDDLYQEGRVGENVISKEQYESLVKHRGDYAPRLVAELTGETSYVGIGGRPVSTRGPGWMKLYGTDRATMLDNRRFIDHMLGNTTERVARNSATRSLYHAVREVNEIEEASGLEPKFARILKKRPQSHLTPTGQKRMQKLVEEGELDEETYHDIMDELWTSKFEKVGKDEVFVGTMIDGEQHGMALNKHFAEQWMKGDPYISSKILNGIQWALLVRPLKMAATMYNPAFALRNIARDMQHAYMVTPGLYSSFLPKGFLQMGADYAKTWRDAWRINKAHSKRYMEAVKDGLGMDFLAGTASWKAHSFDNKTLEKIADVFGYIGESSEIWTRLAIRERGIKKFMKAGKSYEEASRLATYEARNYLDFSQHGSMMHVLDAIFPYANASMQAGRGLFRIARTNPAEFAMKSGQILGFHAWWYSQLRNSHSELYNSLSDYERDNYLIIPAPFLEPVREDGHTRHPYFRIATDQQIRPITALAEILVDMGEGRDVDPMKGVRAVKQMLAIQPDISSFPPLFRILGEYGANYDFWRMEPIWKGRNIPAEMETHKYVNPLAEDVAKATGLSPVRLEHSVESLTANNFFIDMLGMSAVAMKQHLGKGERDEMSKMLLNDIPGLKSIIRYSNPKQRINDNYDAIEKESNAYYLKWSREVSNALDSGRSKSDAFFELSRKIQRAGLPYDERSRIMKMARDQYRMKELGYDTREWQEIMAMGNALSKAQALYENYRKMSEQEQREYLREASRAGIFTGKTRKRFFEIKRNGGRKPDEYDYR